MATHKQIDKNVSDTQDAYGELQWLINTEMPTKAAALVNATNVILTRKDV